MTHVVGTFLRAGLIFLTIGSSTPLIAETENMVTLDNQTGELAIVKLVSDLSTFPVTLSRGEKQTVEVMPGRYYIKVRSGKPGAYFYLVGKPFDILHSASTSSHSTITITKKEVQGIQGDHALRLASEPEFGNTRADIASGTAFTFDYSKSPKTESTEWVVMPATAETMLRSEQNLDSYRTNAQVVFKDVRSPSSPTNVAGITLIDITAEVERKTFVLLGVHGMSAGGLPGIRAYLEIAAGKSNAVPIASNLLVWGGCLYTDGDSVLILKAGTSYSLDNKDAVAGSRDKSATVRKFWEFWK